MTAGIRSEASVNEPTLYVAFELGKKGWHLGMTSGFGVTPRVVKVPARDWPAVRKAIATACRRFGLPAGARVVSCYEAGRDGFWIHRALTRFGIANRVVDSASIEVNRRARRMKTDRMDATKLVLMLVRVCQGEPRVWSEVRVPSAEREAARHVSRERAALIKERTRLRNQITSWLATWGCIVSQTVRRQTQWWERACDWQGDPLPDPVQSRIARAEARLVLVAEQLDVIEAAQVATVRAAAPDTALRRLVRLKGVATVGASVLLEEGLEWRDFRNRRQLGGILGFAPARYESGETSRDQGITRAGNTRLRSTMVQLAWSWVQWQPESALTRWFEARFGRGKRTRKVGIVALARKLLIALWRCATQDIVPTGATLKA